MISVPATLPDDPILLKQLLSQLQTKVVHLEEQNALLRQRLFGRKSEQSVDTPTPQLALFNEAEEELVLAAVEDPEEEPNSHASKSSMNCPNPN